jgi:hypothetical protein
MAAGAVAVGVGAWLVGGEYLDAVSPASGGSPSVRASASLTAPGASGTAPAAAPARITGESNQTIGLTAEQHQQIREALADHPQRDVEIARVTAYLQFAAQWQHFLARRAAGVGAEELKPLARGLDAELDARLQRHEVTAAEAAQIKAALLDVLAPDAASRQTALQQWRASTAAAPSAADPRAAEFDRRQAEVLAAWRALPPAQRDPQQLEAELEALRVSVFTAPRSGASKP